MKVAYVAWILAATAYILNWLTITIALFSLRGRGGEGSHGSHPRGGPAPLSMADWFFATMVGAIGLPASWRFWCDDCPAGRAESAPVSLQRRPVVLSPFSRVCR